MKYDFPVIEDIEQVRNAIKDRPEFVESVKDDYIVFNYLLAKEDSFDCPIRREVRGIIFNKDGKIISRRLHKFFNLGEKEETQSNKIDWDVPHVVLDKLDGSMITPIPLKGGIRWGTKMGITDVSMLCEEFVSDKANYINLAKHCIDTGFTPIFEYISPRNRIVIEYSEENLVLLALRDNITGKYGHEPLVKCLAKHFDVPYVKTYTGDISNIKDLQNLEGVIVRFNNGHMIKIKSEWYIAIHKAKENILFEKNVIKLILEEKIDDIIPNLPESDKNRILDYKEKLLESISEYESIIKETLTRNRHLSKKDFAINVASKLESFIKNVCFTCWEETKFNNVRQEIVKNIIKNTGSQSSVDSIRYILGVNYKNVTN